MSSSSLSDSIESMSLTEKEEEKDATPAVCIFVCPSCGYYHDNFWSDNNTCVRCQKEIPPLSFFTRAEWEAVKENNKYIYPKDDPKMLHQELNRYSNSLDESLDHSETNTNIINEIENFSCIAKNLREYLGEVRECSFRLVHALELPLCNDDQRKQLLVYAKRIQDFNHAVLKEL